MEGVLVYEVGYCYDGRHVRWLCLVACDTVPVPPVARPRRRTKVSETRVAALRLVVLDLRGLQRRMLALLLLGGQLRFRLVDVQLLPLAPPRVSFVNV